MHIRYIKVFDNGDLFEVLHRTFEGYIDIVKVLKAYHEIGLVYKI